MEGIQLYQIGVTADGSNYRGISLLSTTYKVLAVVLLKRIMSYMDEIFGSVRVDFDVDKLLIRHFCSSHIG